MSNDLLEGFDHHALGPQEQQKQTQLESQAQTQSQTQTQTQTTHELEFIELRVIHFYTCDVCLAKVCVCDSSK